MMTPERLEELLRGFDSARIAVVGDYFLDKYLTVDPQLAEPSLETGKTAHQVVDVRAAAGAAGTVVNNLLALEPAAVVAIGVIGQDGEGFELRRALQRAGCDTSRLLESASLRTPTYLKPRDLDQTGLAAEHSRYDTLNRTPLPRDTEQQILEAIDQVLPNVDALVVLDQVEAAECGIVTSGVRSYVCQLAEQSPECVFWADSRFRIERFLQTVIKANQFETTGRDPNRDAAPPIDELLVRALQLRQRTQAPVLITCGERGIVVSDPEPFHVPGLQVTGEIDPTGAGDSVTAAAVLALVAGATCPEAALLGNLVASVTIQQLAETGTASREQLRQQLNAWRSLHAAGSADG